MKISAEENTFFSTQIDSLKGKGKYQRNKSNVLQELNNRDFNDPIDKFKKFYLLSLCYYNFPIIKSDAQKINDNLVKSLEILKKIKQEDNEKFIDFLFEIDRLYTKIFLDNLDKFTYEDFEEVVYLYIQQYEIKVQLAEQLNDVNYILKILHDDILIFQREILEQEKKEKIIEFMDRLNVVINRNIEMLEKDPRKKL